MSCGWVLWTHCRGLFGADYTVEFIVLVIRWAGKLTRVTGCFNMVEQCTIDAPRTLRQELLVFIHTLVHSVLLTQSFRHEVSIVLPGPGGRAAGPGLDHNYNGSSGHIAHSTRSCVPCRGNSYSVPCTCEYPYTPSL